MNLSTFSLVAKDKLTGNIAVAGGTNWFNYGRWVPHAQGGIGAIATQAETNMLYAKNGMELLSQGMSADHVMQRLMQTENDQEGIYQLLIIDRNGEIACHTGRNNYNFAGSIIGDGFAVAGNTLLDQRTIQAVADYYAHSQEDFVIKIIHALQAGHKVGGDIRGMKSAALKVVTPNSTGEFWQDSLYDLRVDENNDPLVELERIFQVAEAYRLIGEAEEAQSPQKAIEKFMQALKYDQNNTEIQFWLAWNYDLLGNHHESEKLLANLSENWHEYWRRLKIRNQNLK